MKRLPPWMTLLVLAAACQPRDETESGEVKTAQALTVINGQIFNFGTLASPGKCLDVAGNSAANGTKIQSWTCNGTSAQSWRLEDAHDGNWRLVDTSSNKCLDATDWGTANGTRLQLWDCTFGANQAFRLEDRGGDNVRFVGVQSGRCVDVAGAGTAEGTQIQLWDCNDTVAQLWRPALLNGAPSAGPSAPAPAPQPAPSPIASGEWPALAARGDGFWVRVRNRCPFPLWIHGQGATGTLQPDDARLGTGEARDYLAPREWPAGRVTAYAGGPRQDELEKGEFTFTGGLLNFNVTYVDWLGLPLEITAAGGNCKAVDTTGCYARQDQVQNGCPQGFLRQGRKCLSARTYCLDPANAGNAYCHGLDAALASCGSPRGTTPEAYACSGAYAEQPRLCAALNRGMCKAPDDPNPAAYYENGPYNDYAKWVHQVCPNIYAFPYDDWLGHGGFRACAGNEVRLTFCPNG